MVDRTLPPPPPPPLVMKKNKHVQSVNNGRPNYFVLVMVAKIVEMIQLKVTAIRLFG